MAETIDNLHEFHGCYFNVSYERAFIKFDAARNSQMKQLN